VNYNTQTLGKYISSRIVLFIKHQNSISQMTRGPFSLHAEIRPLALQGCDFLLLFYFLVAWLLSLES
jgi:hypothetical protein